MVNSMFIGFECSERWTRTRFFLGGAPCYASKLIDREQGIWKCHGGKPIYSFFHDTKEIKACWGGSGTQGQI